MFICNNEPRAIAESLGSGDCSSDDQRSTRAANADSDKCSYDTSYFPPVDELIHTSTCPPTEPSPQVLPVANTVPPEILSQIFHSLNPRDFDNARRTCSQWMRASLDKILLETMLKRAGWWEAWQLDCRVLTQQATQGPASEQSLVWRMSKRIATECLLSGRKMNVERTGFLTTATIDFTRLSHGMPHSCHRRSVSDTVLAVSRGFETIGASRFNVSNCGNYLLVTRGRIIYVYCLLIRKAGDLTPASPTDGVGGDIVLVSRITCPENVLLATMDTSTRTFEVAALLEGHAAMISELDASCFLTKRSRGSSTLALPLRLGPQHVYSNVSRPDDPPRSLSVCPGRRCVAFGCRTGIELHWFDDKTKQSCRKRLSLSHPADILHFLPRRVESPMDFRLISSLAGPGLPGCHCYGQLYGLTRQGCQLHATADLHSLTRPTSIKPDGSKTNLSIIRAVHCHHYRAIPINDGLHILFVEPRTGLLCVGSDAPIGGPTSLTRAFIFIPPGHIEAQGCANDTQALTVFAAGSDLQWGLRIVGAYQDQIVLYSVPIDVFKVIQMERERQGDGTMGDSDLVRDWFIEADHSRKRRETLPNRNGDWEFLLGVSSRPTEMMWPFKIYGKEVGRMDNVVELSLQSSNGGVRVWAFGASGEARVFDIDAFSSPFLPTSTSPCKFVTIGPDGSVTSARFVDSTERGVFSTPFLSRKRKQPEQYGNFKGPFAAPMQQFYTTSLHHNTQRPPDAVPQMIFSSPVAVGRPPYAACIMDFRLPGLGPRQG